MPIFCTACLCNSSDSLIRNFLHQVNYPDWMNIPIYKGKQKSRQALSTLPQYPEVQALDHFIENSSKWAVILGYNEKGCRWADIAHQAAVSKIDAQMIVETFSDSL